MKTILDKLNAEKDTLARIFYPLWDTVDLIGWHNLNQEQKTEYVFLDKKLATINRKITLIIQDNY